MLAREREGVSWESHFLLPACLIAYLKRISNIYVHLLQIPDSLDFDIINKTVNRVRRSVDPSQRLVEGAISRYSIISQCCY